MWIKLLRPHALFYPPRVEPAGSVHSIGTPRGLQLVAAGIAEPAAQPPELDDARVPELRDGDDAQLTKTICRIDAAVAQSRPEMPPLSAQASALVAALSRTVRRRRKR